MPVLAVRPLSALTLAALSMHPLLLEQVHLASFVDSDVFGPGMLLGLMSITTATLVVALRMLGETSSCSRFGFASLSKTPVDLGLVHSSCSSLHTRQVLLCV